MAQESEEVKTAAEPSKAGVMLLIPEGPHIQPLGNWDP